MNKTRQRSLIAFIVFLAIVTTIGVLAIALPRIQAAERPAVTATKLPEKTTPTPKQETTPPVKDVTFTVAATGDVLSHQPVITHSRQSDGSYDVEPLLSEIKPYIEGADMGIFHTEIPFASDDSHITGYPVFAAPMGWAHSVKKLGYDATSLASNHTLDQGQEGIARTIDLYNKEGIGTTGANKSGDQQQVQYYKLVRNNREILIAHLSLTYGINQGITPQVHENPWLVNIDNPDHIIGLAKTAREKGADVVIVSAHNGDEYQSAPTESQINWAKKFAESKYIDLYIGHHAHVPQKAEKVPGGPDGKGMWAFYGTGNLLSHMQNQPNVGTQTGYIAQATITVPEKGSAHVDSVGWTGIILDRSQSKVYLAHNYKQSEHPGAQLSDETATNYYSYLKSILGDTPEITSPPKSGGDTPKMQPRD